MKKLFKLPEKLFLQRKERKIIRNIELEQVPPIYAILNEKERSYFWILSETNKAPRTRSLD